MSHSNLLQHPAQVTSILGWTPKPGLSLATQALTSARGRTFIWSTFTCILKAHLSGGRDLTSRSISVFFSGALDIMFFFGSIVLKFCAAVEGHLQ